MPRAGLHHPQLRQQRQHGEYHAGPAEGGADAAVRHGGRLCRRPASRFCCGSIVETSLDISRIRAITLDLDDTLWPVWPAIARAEAALAGWLAAHAPATAALFGDAQALRALRVRMEALRPDLRHDLSALRRESIRMALAQAGDDPGLAEPAFDFFFAERQRVDLFDDALATLDFLAARYPVVAVSNGNADVKRIGIGRYFTASLSATRLGFAKPDARIFHAGAQAAGVASAAVLHVGDDALLDAQGALGAGMQAAWLNTAGSPWPHDGAPPHVTVASLGALCRLLD
ncbi:MAG: HAD-IA family hydrolase [Proteobacteria bacterium]|nr:HAD-IA family hydrolase [Pseudomonadota bacterium]